MRITLNEIPKNHFLVKYYIESRTNLYDAAFGLAVGQSIGNPSVRNIYETDELIQNHCAKIIGDEGELKKLKSGYVEIAFPSINVNWEEDGISHFICNIMGGQVDIDIIEKCHVLDFETFDFYEKLTPKFGITGIREKTKRFDKPILGCILKPKIGLTPKQLGEIVQEMIDGGTDIIKEDEIMSNPVFCTYEDRLPIISEIIKDTNVIYLATVNGDPHRLLDKINTAHKFGTNGVHVNIWSGLGSYRSVRKLDLPIALHYQKSGDKVITDPSNNYRISWYVLCKLASMSGVDTIHTGMWGGYLSDDPDELKNTMDLLVSNNVLPALSCGMTAELIPKITEKFGFNYMANVGGAVHSDSKGIKSAVIKLRKAIDENNSN